jgi:uncharacterized DUF497 family protein
MLQDGPSFINVRFAGDPDCSPGSWDPMRHAPVLGFSIGEGSSDSRMGSRAPANLAAHKVSFEEAVTAFQDPLAVLCADPDHSEGERREILVGHSVDGPLILVSFTDREGRIRIISARRATRREHRDYEESQRQES